MAWLGARLALPTEEGWRHECNDQQRQAAWLGYAEAGFDLKHEARIVGVLQTPRTVVAAAGYWTEVARRIVFPRAIERTFGVGDDPILGVRRQLHGAAHRC